MKVDFNRVLYGLDGKPLLTPEGNELTLRKVCSDALVIGLESDRETSGEEKLKRYLLGVDIYSSIYPLDVTVEQIALIKKLIEKGFPSPLVSGQAWKMLEE